MIHEGFEELLRKNAEHADQFRESFDHVQDAQRPDAVTVCCSDSRVLQDHMWGNDEPGRLFTCSNIGNRVIQRADSGETVSGDVLYPIEHTGTDLVVVVGHTGCGAVTATYDDLTGGLSEPPGITHCLELLGPHLERGVERLSGGVDRREAVNRLVEYNVDRQIEHLDGSREVQDGVTLVGCVYDFQDVYGGQRGEIHVCNVNGETNVEVLREENPEVASRIRRLWEY